MLATKLPGEEVTEYEVIATPPPSAGAEKEMVALVRPAEIALVIAGGEGARGRLLNITSDPEPVALTATKVPAPNAVPDHCLEIGVERKVH